MSGLFPCTHQDQATVPGHAASKWDPETLCLCKQGACLQVVLMMRIAMPLASEEAGASTCLPPVRDCESCTRIKQARDRSPDREPCTIRSGGPFEVGNILVTTR